MSNMPKISLIILSFIVGFFIFSTPVQAATLYFKAAGGNFNGANWSTTGSGGTDSNTPTAADDCILEAGSGALTINTSSVCRSLNINSGTGGYDNAITHTAGVTLNIGDATAGLGNKALDFSGGGSSFRYTLGNATTSAISFISTSTTQQTVNFAGKTSGNVTYVGVAGSWQMTGTHNTGTTATVTLTKGTLDTNGQTMSIGNFNSSNTNVRTLTLGASAITITASASAGTPWNLGTTTNLTFTDNTASITYNGGGSGVTNFAGGGLSYGGTVSFISVRGVK